MTIYDQHSFHKVTWSVQVSESYRLICCAWFQFVGLEALTTAISDLNPTFFHVGHRRKLLLLAISVFCFFLGLVMVTDVRPARSAVCLLASPASNSQPSASDTGWTLHLPAVRLLRLQRDDSAALRHPAVLLRWLAVR